MPRYLNSRTAEELNALFSGGFDSSDSHTFGRFEVYSCNRLDNQDKKLFQAITTQFQQLQNEQAAAQEIFNQRRQRTISQNSSAGGSGVINVSSLRPERKHEVEPLPPSSASPTDNAAQQQLQPNSRFTIDSRLSGLSKEQTQKMLVHLIGTLNSAYPDYDFSNVKAHHFRRRSASTVSKELSTLLFNVGGDLFAQRISERLWNALDEIVGPNALMWLPELTVANSDENVPLAILKATGPADVEQSLPWAETASSITTSAESGAIAVNSTTTTAAIATVNTSANGNSSNSSTITNNVKRKRSNSRAAKSLQAEQPIPPPLPIGQWDESMDVYTYEPDVTAGNPFDDEDDGMGSLWGFHYLFFNRKFKRMVYFGIHATAITAEQNSEVTELGCWEEDTAPDAIVDAQAAPPSTDADTINRSEVVVTTSVGYMPHASSSIQPPPQAPPVLSTSQIKYSSSP